MLHLGYEHDKNDVHDVMLLCETFQIAIPVLNIRKSKISVLC